MQKDELSATNLYEESLPKTKKANQDTIRLGILGFFFSLFLSFLIFDICVFCSMYSQHATSSSLPRFHSSSRSCVYSVSPIDLSIVLPVAHTYIRSYIFASTLYTTSPHDHTYNHNQTTMTFFVHYLTP
jgi:hypothetical protein